MKHIIVGISIGAALGIIGTLLFVRQNEQKKPEGLTKVTKSSFENTVSNNVPQGVLKSPLAVNPKTELPDAEKIKKYMVASLSAQMIRRVQEKLTEYPDALVNFERFSSKAVGAFYEASELLTKSNYTVKTFNLSSTASIPCSNNPKEAVDFVFCPALCTVQQFEKTSDGGATILSRAVFYETGQLKSFETVHPKREMLSFQEDGQLQVYWTQGQGQNDLTVQLTSEGKLRVSGYRKQQ